MSENKFIKRLKGEQTAKSVLEIKNESAKTSFANMPQGTSNAINVYSDHRGNATAVLEGTDIWKLNNSLFVATSDALGDGRDFTSTYTVAGSSLWVNATYTFAQPKIFTGATQWVLKLCGHSLLSRLSNTIGFSLIIKFGNAVTITKSFSVSESAFEFCKEFIIDFSEGEQTAVKVADGDTMTVQLLCADATASATIYNGMTTLVALQRRVDGETVASDLHTFEDLEVEVADIQDDIDQIHDDIDDLKDYCDETFLPLAGGTLTGDLAFQYNANNPKLRIIQSGQNTNHLRFINNTYASQSVSFDLSQAAIHPLVTGRGHVGTSDIHFGDAHIDKIYTPIINNGYDISVPVTASAQTLALKSEVDLAANSGRMITDQGVWYAKMYAATVVPAAEDGTNYADFSQTDGQGNPIIVIYERQSGAWVQSETITPPAEYDGYVPITSKIWDITEQAGQQGGRILWNHQSKEFTPYPQIISFEDIEITGDSTVIMPQNPSASQIVNKDYVDNKVSSSIGNGTITLTQNGNTMGIFTTNQSGDTTIALDGGSSYHPDLFDVKWADHILNDASWLRADTFSWQSGDVYQAAYQHLYDDYLSAYKQTTLYRVLNIGLYYRSSDLDDLTAAHPYAFTGEVGAFSIVYADTEEPSTNDYFYQQSDSGAAAVGQINGTETQTILVRNYEKIAGTTITYYKTEDGHKLCPANQENNVQAIYNATGVAWYYIFDRTHQSFKLPRINPDKELLIDIGTSAPVITSNVNHIGGSIPMKLGVVETSTPSNYGSGNPLCVYGDNGIGANNANGGWGGQRAQLAPINLETDLSNTNEYYKGKKYLYFYVGQFTQTAIENTAGINTELFNNKADITAVAGLAAPDYQNITQLSNIDSYQQIQGDGYILIQGAGGGTWNTIGIVISLDGSTDLLQITQANIYGITYLVPVSKGVYVKRYDSHVTAMKFIPCRGNN